MFKKEAFSCKLTTLKGEDTMPFISLRAPSITCIECFSVSLQVYIIKLDTKSYEPQILNSSFWKPYAPHRLNCLLKISQYIVELF